MVTTQMSIYIHMCMSACYIENNGCIEQPSFILFANTAELSVDIFVVCL